jgi:hypothetical protein
LFLAGGATKPLCWSVVRVYIRVRHILLLLFELTFWDF